MNSLNLTQDEINLILKNREIVEQERKDYEFRKRAIKTAHEWLEWSEKAEMGLTFSTFVNEFGFDELNASQYYNVIVDILNAVSEYSFKE